MPTTIVKQGRERWKGVAQFSGKRREKLFGPGPKGGPEYKKAVVWEGEERRRMAEAHERSMIHSVSLTLLEWGTAYLEFSHRKHSPAVFEEKRRCLKRFLSFCGADKPVEGATPVLVMKFLQAQQKDGYSPNRVRKELMAAWAYGKWIDGFPRDSLNPFQEAPTFPQEKNPRHVPTVEDLRRVLDVAKGQDWVLLMAYLHTGARRGELFRLRWQDIDFHGDKVSLSTRKREGGNLESDYIPITSELKEALLWWRRECPIRDAEHVFLCLDRTAFCDQYYGKPFKVRQHWLGKLCEKADVTPFGFHGIRHLTATVLYHSGMEVPMIQRTLRHKSPATTMRYLHRLGLGKTRGYMEKALSGIVRTAAPWENQNEEAPGVAAPRASNVSA